MFDYRRVVLQSSMIVAVSGNAGGAVFALPHLRLCHYWRCLHGAPSPVLGKIPWFVIISPRKNGHLEGVPHVRHTPKISLLPKMPNKSLVHQLFRAQVLSFIAPEDTYKSYKLSLLFWVFHQQCFSAGVDRSRRLSQAQAKAIHRGPKTEETVAGKVARWLGCWMPYSTGPRRGGRAKRTSEALSGGIGDVF